MTLIMSTREMVPKPSCSTSPTLSPTIRSCHSCPLSFFTQTMAILACFFQPTKRKSYQNWVDHRPLPLFSRWWKEMAIWVGFVSYCTCKSPILLSWLVGHILGNLVSKRNAWPSSTIYWWLIASKCRAKCRRYQMPLWLKMVDIALLISGQDCRGFALQQNIQEFLANLCICRVYRIYLCIYFLHTHSSLQLPLLQKFSKNDTSNLLACKKRAVALPEAIKQRGPWGHPQKLFPFFWGGKSLDSQKIAHHHHCLGNWNDPFHPKKSHHISSSSKLSAEKHPLNAA